MKSRETAWFILKQSISLNIFRIPVTILSDSRLITKDHK